MTVSELTAMTFGVTAMLAATAASRSARIAAVPLFAAALLCKENVLLLPLLLVWPGFDSAPWRERAKRAAGLLAPGALLAIYLVGARAGTRTFGGDAYASGIGPHLFHNLMTFAAWSVDLGSPVPDLVTLASPTAWHVGLPVVLGLAVIAIACWRSARLPAIGLGWWLLTLAPALPLLRHAYLFYLYVPFAGAAMVVGAGWENGVRALTRRMSHPPPVAVVAGITALLLVGHAALSVVRLRERRAMRIEGVDLPFDPFLRKSEVARRVAEPFRDAVRNGTTRAVFVLPLEGVWTFASQTGARARAAASNPQYAVLPTVLHEGLALRALNPSVDSVAFVSRWTAAYRDVDLFTAAPDARMIQFGHGPDAHARFALVLLNARLDRTARDHLEQALVAWPHDPRLEFEHAIALGHLGDVDGERRELAELLRRDPTGPVSGPAQARLTALGPAPR